MTRVTTTAGVVGGTTTVTRRADIESYLGIPFAGRPDGNGRFRPPSEPTPWEGVLDVKHSGPAAPQNPDPLLAQGGFWQPPIDEAACLNLNIWTPGADDRGRPVLVWIHGGANVTGSNSSGYNNGSELAAALDVVVVSINHRLGALGFLTLDHLLGPEFATSGNTAVLDQIQALRWIRANIAAFGGDPETLTLFGESAGAASVGTLLGTPRAEGLFRRAIMQSGTAERARSTEQAREITAEFLEDAGIPERDAERVLTLPVEQLLGAQAKLLARHAAQTIGLSLPFQAVIDGDVLPRLPIESVRAGLNSDADLLVGTNLNEASFFTVVRPTSPTGSSPAEQIDSIAREDLGGTATLERYRAVLAAELGQPPADDALLESLLSDRLYRQPTNRLLDARADARGRTFSYLFTWPSPLNDGKLGACHALDVPFVFRQLHRLESVSLVGENPPRELSDWMSGAWVEFARRGAPRFPALPDWPDYEPGRRATMVLDRRPEVVSDPRGELRRIWLEAGAG